MAGVQYLIVVDDCAVGVYEVVGNRNPACGVHVDGDGLVALNCVVIEDGDIDIKCGIASVQRELFVLQLEVWPD